MKIQSIKTLLKVTLLALLPFFNSCTNTKNQTEEMINLNRTILNDDLEELKEEKTITQNEFEQMHKRLNADLDYYIQHQDIDFAGLEKMFLATTKSFENIKINQPIFSMIISTYGNITGQIRMRNSPLNQEDYAIELKLSNAMNDWFENYQPDSEKIADLIAQINRQKKVYKDISASEYDDIIATITRIKNDTTISANELKKTLIDGMLKYCNKSNDSNLSILNIYGAVDRIKKLGIHDELSAIYNKNKTQPKEPSYSEIKQQVADRFKILLKEDMITQAEYNDFTQTIINDVEFCEKSTDKAQIKAQILASLKKLKPAELDTEDREAIVDWYFILSQKSKIDIKSDLNKWLYDFDLD